MSRRPLLPLALAFAAGAALPWSGGARVRAGVGTAAALLAISPPLAPAAFVGAGWVAGAARRAAAATAAPVAAGDAPVRLEGRVASVPDRLDGGRVRFLLREARGALLQAVAPDLAWPLALGDRVALEARLRAPEPALDPGGRDRAAALAARGVALEAWAAAAPARVAPPSPLAALERARRRFSAAAAAALPPGEAALVRAVGAGDRTGVDAPLAQAFARSGLAHLLSVSGLHLAVIAWGVYRLVRAALLRWDAAAARVDPRRAAAAVALPVAAAYALATGADVPVVRSALAAGVGLGGVLVDREPDALNALALAALTLLALDPGALRDPSFQLSFASVAGLTLAAGRLRRTVPVEPCRATWPGRLREAALGAVYASAAATLATAPIVAFHFRRLSLVALASNVAGVPIGAVLTVTSAAAAAAGALAPALARPLLLLCRPPAWLLLALARRCAAPGWAAPAIGSPGAWGVLACEGALLAALRLRGRWRAVALAAAAAALLGPPVARRALALRRGGLEVVFLAVGQGDAAVFLLPDGAAVVVDAGGDPQGRYDPGARVVVPFLLDAGVRRVAALVASHPHPDHVLGLPAVAAALPVARLYASGRRGGDDVAAAWAALPAPTRLDRGDVFTLAGVRFEALGPPPASEAWSENDASLVLRVTYGATAFLLCGDVEAEGEAALARSPAALRADVVKLPHHGSATSSSPALVIATGARFAVASAPRASRFGFPAAAVEARWTAAGAAVLRTGEGAVRFLSDGRSVRLTPAADALDLLALARERL